MRFFIIQGIFTGLFLVIFSGCASMTPEERQQHELERMAVEVNDEIMVGRQMAAKLMGHLKGDSKDKKTLEYLNLVGQTLVKCVGRPELDYHFGVLNTDHINAYATPGGYIFVTRPLLKSLKNESELAGILSHEIAHVNEKHMYNEIVPKREVSASETMVRMMSRGRSELGGSLSVIVNKGLNMLLETGLKETVEFEADEAGSVYAASCGYNPVSLITVLKRFQSNGGQLKFSKVHPPEAARIAQLETALRKNGLEDRMAAKESVLKVRFERVVASMR